jgi:hypothetical protein
MESRGTRSTRRSESLFGTPTPRRTANPAELRPALQTRIADLAVVDIPACDIVNASLSLPFLAPTQFWPAWQRVLDAVVVGGRVAAMLFGDRDGSAGDASMTCPPPDAIRESLASFEIEHWANKEEDTLTALGGPHHFHTLELVARRLR